MKHLSRRRFIALAAGATGIVCVPRRLLAAASAGSQDAEPWPSCPRTPPSSGEDGHSLVYLLVAMPDAGVVAEVSKRYRPFMHVCYPPTRRPCWCGGWHESSDPVNFVLVVGTPAPNLRLRQAARGLFILPAEATPIEGTAMNVVKGPACGFGSWATRAIEQASEPFLIPGLIGSDLADMIAMLGESTEQRFDFGTSPAKILDAGAIAVAHASPWLAQASGLLVRITGKHDLTIEDVNTICSTVGDAAHPEANIIFSAAIADENVVGVMGG